MPDKDYYYLTAEEMRHYKYMLSHEYSHKLVQTGSQKYLVFPIVDKLRIGIAWPTLTGNLDGLSKDVDSIFSPYLPLQRIILPLIQGSTIRVLMFPRYAD
jgi:hypothetical protein